MKMYWKSIVISMVILIMGISFIFFSVNKYQSNFNEFQNDGHVIIYNSSNIYEKYNFSENETYRIVNESVVFNDNDAIKREISKYQPLVKKAVYFALKDDDQTSIARIYNFIAVDKVDVVSISKKDVINKKSITLHK